MSGQDQRSADFDATSCPIIARHWFGVKPLHPIGSTIFPIVRRLESIEDVTDAPA